REVADLEEVHQPLETGVLAARADGHLHLAPLAAHQKLGQIVELETFFIRQAIQQILDASILWPERFGKPLAERLEVEEVEVEEAIEGRQVARFLDERGGQRGLERLAVGETDLRAGRERVERLRGRDAQLGPAQVADELEDSLVHLIYRRGGCAGLRRPTVGGSPAGDAPRRPRSDAPRRPRSWRQDFVERAL